MLVCQLRSTSVEPTIYLRNNVCVERTWSVEWTISPMQRLGIPSYRFSEPTIVPTDEQRYYVLPS